MRALSAGETSKHPKDAERFEGGFFAKVFPDRPAASLLPIAHLGEINTYFNKMTFNAR
jgi:hypothetical protein